MSALWSLTLVVHILAGVIALLAGLAAIVTTKGGRRHNQAGRLYVRTMAIVVVTALPLAAWTDNWFLFSIAIFSGYLVFAGARVIQRRRAQLEAYTPTDWLGHGTMLVAGAAMIGTGSWQIASGTVGLAPVLIVFGVIGGLLALGAILESRRPAADCQPWFQQHIVFMGGAYIATVTATITVNLTMVPALIRWLGPTAIGTPLIFYAVSRYRQRFGRPPSAASGNRDRGSEAAQSPPSSSDPPSGLD